MVRNGAYGQPTLCKVAPTLDGCDIGFDVFGRTEGYIEINTANPKQLWDFDRCFGQRDNCVEFELLSYAIAL